MTRHFRHATAQVRHTRRALAHTGRAALAVVLAVLTALQGAPATAVPASGSVPVSAASAIVAPRPPGSMVIDYPGGFTSSLPARLRSADVGIVVRYVGAAKWKCLTRAEANALRAAGIDIATVYEAKANWMLGGRAAGVAAAKKARAAVVACGGPSKPFVYFACDISTRRYSTVNACLRGAASVLGADHVGIYGSYYVCASALNNKAAAKAWQTEAWSGGKWLPRAVLHQTAKRVNGSLGISYDSNVLRADDVGQWGYKSNAFSWSRSASAGTSATLNAVDFVDASHGWAVGEGGTIARTSDGGTTWTATSTAAATGAALKGVAFADAGNGCAVGEGRTIVRTIDGGSTWVAASASPVTTATLNSVAFADARNGWAVGENGTIIRTTDGGSTWTAASSDAVTTATLNSVSFTDASHGVAVGQGGVVIRTTDGGSTWATASASVPGAAALNGVAFNSSSIGLAVGAGGTVIRTADGGSTWTTASASPPTTTTLNAVAFSDATNGWAVGEHGTIIRTTDGGSSWTVSAASSGTTTTLRAVAFADANNGCAVGDAGTVVHAVRPGGPSVLGHVAGVVTDAKSGKPVSGASVQIGARPAIPTATDGSFLVTRVTPGVYTVTVRSPRYITCASKGVTVTADATATVKIQSTPRAATSITKPVVSPGTPARGQGATLTATLSPASAASSTVSTIYLSHYEAKMVTKKVKGKPKKFKVWYWRLRWHYRMAADAPGSLHRQVALAHGRWRAIVKCAGSGTYLPSTSPTTSFSVR